MEELIEQNQNMNLIAENKNLKERLTALELLCKILQQKIDKMEEDQEKYGSNNERSFKIE
jgi:hypothetical protein